MEFFGKEQKGVYAVDVFSRYVSLFAFSKKEYPTKELAIQKFNEITNNADIEEITEKLVRFCWWTEDRSSYEYPNEDVRRVCGYRTTNKKCRGAFDCWIIEQNMHWERLCENMENNNAILISIKHK